MTLTHAHEVTSATRVDRHGLTDSLYLEPVRSDRLPAIMLIRPSECNPEDYPGRPRFRHNDQAWQIRLGHWLNPRVS
ncbi:uncharacterized protein METZ01_LOCUS363014 [marine metagenome]|uniref:Uncharacterized protein n=1 Tax=marine metagenome TaxID=408172 RepID=A0A382SJL1_9ZZZZ